MSDPGDDMALLGDEGQACEYVLGTLPLPERMAFEARLRIDAALTARVQVWEAHFAPLNDGYAEIPAPNLLPAIEGRLFPARPVRPRFALWAALGGLVAATLVAVALLSPFNTPARPDLVATLAATGQPLVFAASYDRETMALTVRRTSGDAPGLDQDYQLWVIGTSGVPQSLGVMAAPEITRSESTRLNSSHLARSRMPSSA